MSRPTGTSTVSREVVGRSRAERLLDGIFNKQTRAIRQKVMETKRSSAYLRSAAHQRRKRERERIFQEKVRAHEEEKRKKRLKVEAMQRDVDAIKALQKLIGFVQKKEKFQAAVTLIGRLVETLEVEVVPDDVAQAIKPHLLEALNAVVDAQTKADGEKPIASLRSAASTSRTPVIKLFERAERVLQLDRFRVRRREARFFQVLKIAGIFSNRLITDDTYVFNPALSNLKEMIMSMGTPEDEERAAAEAAAADDESSDMGSEDMEDSNSEQMEETCDEENDPPTDVKEESDPTSEESALSAVATTSSTDVKEETGPSQTAVVHEGRTDPPSPTQTRDVTKGPTNPPASSSAAAHSHDQSDPSGDADESFDHRVKQEPPEESPASVAQPTPELQNVTKKEDPKQESQTDVKEEGNAFPGAAPTDQGPSWVMPTGTALHDLRRRLLFLSLSTVVSFVQVPWARVSVETFFDEVYAARSLFIDPFYQERISEMQGEMKKKKKTGVDVIARGIAESANPVRDGREEKISTIHGSQRWSDKQLGLG